MALSATFGRSVGRVADVTTTTGLRERKKEATTERLREVALALVAERGFDAVSIDDIAAAADVSKTTFYRYFETKEDVLLGKSSDNLEILRASLEECPAEVPAVEAARHAFHRLAETYQADRAQKLLVERLTATDAVAGGAEPHPPGPVGGGHPRRRRPT